LIIIPTQVVCLLKILLYTKGILANPTVKLLRERERVSRILGKRYRFITWKEKILLLLVCPERDPGEKLAKHFD